MKIPAVINISYDKSKTLGCMLSDREIASLLKIKLDSKNQADIFHKIAGRIKNKA